MLNSNKTWQEEFKNKFPDKIARVIDDFGDTTKSDLEQFISDLRKKDEEELINIIKQQAEPYENSKWFNNLSFETIKKIIEDHYENN